MKGGFDYLEKVEPEEIKCHIRNLYEVISNKNSYNFSTNFEPEKWEVLYERNLIISLSYFYGKNEKTMNERNNCELCRLIGGEVAKEIEKDSVLAKTYLSIKGTELKGCLTVFPDFLVHENHDNSDLDPEKQHLIIEAKTNSKLPSKDFNWDFFKLNLYLEKLAFKNAVYLIINLSVDKVEKRISKYLDLEPPYLSNNLDKMYFFIKESIEKNFEIYRFKNTFIRNEIRNNQ